MLPRVWPLMDGTSFPLYRLNKQPRGCVVGVCRTPPNYRVLPVDMDSAGGKGLGITNSSSWILHISGAEWHIVWF